MPSSIKWCLKQLLFMQVAYILSTVSFPSCLTQLMLGKLISRIYFEVNLM